MVPLFEMEDGKVTKVRKIKKKIPVEEYLKTQKRFKHMFSDAGGREEIQTIQTLADSNIERYGLLKKTDPQDAEVQD